MQDHTKISQRGWFQGYDYVTVLMIACVSLGGLVVALVVKHADNITKGFATSLSIIVSGCISA